MSIKPSPTIAGKLRKLFSNNKQTIEPAINESIPGGGGRFDVVITSDDGTTFTADKTLAEIQAAYQSGMVVILHDEVDYHGVCVADVFDNNVMGVISRFISLGGTSATIELTYIEGGGHGWNYTTASVAATIST